MLPSIFDLGQYFTNFGSKVFNDEFDASHYLFTCDLFAQGHRASRVQQAQQVRLDTQDVEDTRELREL